MTIENAEAAQPAMEAYAKARGLMYFDNWSMPEPTQLLQHGFTEEVPNLVMGDLPGGLDDAWLAHFDYMTIGAKVHDHLFTVVLARAEASVQEANRILCHDRDLSHLDTENPQSGLELVELDDSSVKLESDAFLERYALWTDHDQDQLRVRQLFGPALISWLTDEAPADLSFEIQNGAVCCFVPGVVSDAESLDALCMAASRILGRLREIDDGDGSQRSTATSEPDREEITDSELAEHHFDSPPRSVFGAALHFGPIPLLSKASWRLGAEAFFRSRVEAVGMKRIEPSEFLASHIDTVLPGAATQVAGGRLPGTELDGYLLWTTELDHRNLSWEVVLAEIGPDDNGYAFTTLDEADKAQEDGFDLTSDGGSISIFRATGDPRSRSAAQLKEFLDRACPLLEMAVMASKERPG